MSGILGSYSDSTCNTHNALRNITEYACGVTFTYKDTAFPPDMHYGVVSLQKCCDEVNAPVMRIPGNTGCEMQFCHVPEATTSSTYTVEYGYATGSGTAARTPEPTVTSDVKVGPPGRLENCMAFVYKGDLPDDVGDKIASAGNWCVVRMYDDEIDEADVSAAVTASPAPASWTTAAVNQWEMALSSWSATKDGARATSTSTSTNGGAGRYADRGTEYGVRIWAAVALMTVGLVIAL
ncbi:Uu.00g006040.m01.CDS01 [Anthostomella pinea]|uniref:Uu.00g006040.m01.CDS01 n=1 Tax=Anthostomella pinea TaxID=933095 RepID=A0AAI8VK71_9PEZI|nr:Uu.00g006040.m01.CDS01 [Anthostomella pinea]